MTSIIKHLSEDKTIPAWLFILLLIFAMIGFVAVVAVAYFDRLASEEGSQPAPEAKRGAKSCQCANQFCPDCHPENIEKPERPCTCTMSQKPGECAVHPAGRSLEDAHQDMERQREKTRATIRQQDLTI